MWSGTAERAARIRVVLDQRQQATASMTAAGERGCRMKRVRSGFLLRRYYRAIHSIAHNR
ncbi:MAG: hypothetical protein ACLTCB_01990 [Merdibacter sp.]